MAVLVVYAGRGVSVERLHRAPGYLVRLFKCATGLPADNLPSRHRVELAATQLLHTDRSIEHIARSVGWPAQKYFAADSNSNSD